MYPDKPQVALVGAIIATIQFILIASATRDSPSPVKTAGSPTALAEPDLIPARLFDSDLTAINFDR